MRSNRGAATILALAILMVLLLVSAGLLNDPDTFWHVETGRLIVSTRSVPEVDRFSHTFAGAPWIAKEWLSQILLFAAFAAGGWWAVAVATAVIAAATFALLFGWLIRRIRPLFALAAVLIAVLLAAPEILARPHLLVLPIILLWFSGLADAREIGRAPRWWVAALMIPWANMHASYPMGLVLAGLIACEAVANAPHPDRRKAVAQWGLFLALAAVAACVSPYGYRTFLVVLSLAQTSETTSFITEWQPLTFNMQGIVAVLSLATALSILALRWRENIFRIVAVLLLGYLMVKHARFALLFGLVTPILLATPLTRVLGQSYARPLPVRVPYMRTGLAALSIGVLIIAALVRPQPSAAVAPEAALAVARSHGLQGHVYNEYDFGGFLIFNGVQTFIDGRADQLFTGGFSDRLNRAIAEPGNTAFRSILDRHEVTWALVKPGSQDAAHFAAMDDWSRLFGDDHSMLYAKSDAVRQARQ